MSEELKRLIADDAEAAWSRRVGSCNATRTNMQHEKDHFIAGWNRGQEALRAQDVARAPLTTEQRESIEHALWNFERNGFVADAKNLRALLAAPAAPAVAPDTCDQDVYKLGRSIGLFDIPKDTANAICSGINAVTGARVDWHYVAGRVHMKALPAPAQAEQHDTASLAGELWRAAAEKELLELAAFAGTRLSGPFQSGFLQCVEEIATRLHLSDELRNFSTREDAQAEQQGEPESSCDPADICAGCRCKYNTYGQAQQQGDKTCQHDWTLSITDGGGNSPWVCRKCGMREQPAANAEQQGAGEFVKLYRDGDVYQAYKSDTAGIAALQTEGWVLAEQPSARVALSEAQRTALYKQTAESMATLRTSFTYEVWCAEFVKRLLAASAAQTGESKC